MRNNQGTMMVHKHPIPRKRVPVPNEFVMQVRPDGTQVGSWQPKIANTRIPNGSPGVLGAIVDSMRRGAGHFECPFEKNWSPPVDYEFVAKHMPDEQAYLKKCRDWCEAHPPPPPVPKVEKPKMNVELLLALQEKYEGSAPPMAERVKVAIASGFSAKQIATKIERMKKWKEEAEIIIGTGFLTDKPPLRSKGKVIKAVKKRT